MIIILPIITNNIYSNSTLKSISDKINVDFYIYESEFAPGKYINIDYKKLGLKKFDRKELSQEKIILKRMYTLRGDFYINESLKNSQLSIMLPPADYNYDVYINGKKIERTNRFRTSNIYLIKEILNYGKKKNDITIQFFPTFEKSPISNIVISSLKRNTIHSFYKNLLNVYLIQGTSLIAFILFLYFIFIFIAGNYKEKKYLYFGCTCILFISCYYNIIFSHNYINVIINERISRCSFPLISMFLTLFILDYTNFFNKTKLQKKIKIILHFVIIIPSVIISIITFIQTTKFHIYKMFSISTNYIIPINMFICFLFLTFFVLFQIKQYNFSPIIILAGFISIIVSAFFDIYYFNITKSPPYFWLTPYGYIITVTTIFLSLAIEQANLYKLSQKYNIELQTKVNERTIKLENAKFELEKTNEKLKNLDLLKNDFIANITHNFRSPLTAVLNISDLALKFGIKNEKENEENYSIIYNASLKLKNFIDKLLDLAKMDAKGVSLRIQKINIISFINEILDFYKSTVFGSNIKIINKISNININNLYSDGDKLEEVIHNIISNAIKFVDPENGKITVDLINLKNVIRIEFSDNGIGIPKEKLNKIFERFEQVNKSRNSPYGGTGIGLAYAKQLMKYIHGKIWAESEGKGKGAKFILELKKGKNIFELKDFNQEKNMRKKNKNISTLLKSEIHKKLKKNKIEVYFNNINSENELNYKKSKFLIIDDDTNIIEILMKYLTNYGYSNFITANDGLQGLNAVYDYDPDIIICDYNMPNMKGDIFHDQIIQNPKYKNIPFIFLSAVADNKLIIERRLKGANDFLQKPIDENILHLTVEQTLKNYFEYLKTIQLATYDELTELINKRAVKMRLNEELSKRVLRNISLIFFDIDNFKNINDTYGHIAGDKIIASIGKELKDSIRSYDIAGRFGGDEFVVVLPDTNKNSAGIVANTIRKNIIKKNIIFNNKQIKCTASFGISSLIENADNICNMLNIKNLKEIFEISNLSKNDWKKISNIKKNISNILFNLADKAMYEAKTSSCQQCSFTSKKATDFINKKCPVCNSKNIILGKNRIVIYE